MLLCSEAVHYSARERLLWKPRPPKLTISGDQNVCLFGNMHCDQKCYEIENSWYSCEDSRHSLRKENWKNKFFSMIIVTMENYDQATSILFLLLTAACCLFVLFQVRYWLLRVLFSPQSYLLRGMKYSFLNNWNNWSLSTKVINIFHYSFLIFATYVYFHTHLLFAKLTINFIFASGSKGPGQHSVSFVCGT